MPARGTFARLASAEAPDPLTVVLKLKEHFAPFLHAFDATTAPIIPSARSGFPAAWPVPATADEVKALRREAGALKEVVADLVLENRLLKKA